MRTCQDNTTFTFIFPLPLWPWHCTPITQIGMKSQRSMEVIILSTQRTHTHIHTHTQRLTHTHTHTLTSQTHTHTHTHTSHVHAVTTLHTHARVCARTHTHTHTPVYSCFLSPAWSYCPQLPGTDPHRNPSCLLLLDQTIHWHNPGHTQNRWWCTLSLANT